MSRRFQFSLRALLVAIFGAACFFGGMAFQRELYKPTSHSTINLPTGAIETITLRDGTKWSRATGCLADPTEE
jgi:hypothetical protein